MNNMNLKDKQQQINLQVKFLFFLALAGSNIRTQILV